MAAQLSVQLAAKVALGPLGFRWSPQAALPALHLGADLRKFQNQTAKS